MMISFGKGGKSGKAAADYMLSDDDHKGMTRAGVSVLRGDPYLTAQIADTLDYSHNYSSGIIAWSPEEQPTQTEIDEVLDDFERLTFAGLTSEQYSWSAVQHNDDREGTHIHFMIARIELNSGNSFNPAQPGWRKQGFDSLRDHYNNKYGWASPKDKGNKRLLSVGKTQGNTKEIKEAITTSLIERIEVGLIKDRHDVISSLQEIGEITRQGKDYISVKLDGAEKAIRLKGTLYEQSFSIEALSEIREAASQRSSRGGRVDDRLAAEAFEQYQESLEKRAEYNIRRYRKAEPQELVEAVVDRSDDLAGHLSRQLGDSAISNKRDIADEPRAPKPTLAKTTTNKDDAAHSDNSLWQRAVRKGRRIKTQLQQQLQSITASISDRLKRDQKLKHDYQVEQANIRQLNELQAREEAQAVIEAAKRKQEEQKQVRNEEPEHSLRM